MIPRLILRPPWLDEAARGIVEGKGKGPGKEEKPPPNSSFSGHCRSCGKWGHRANEWWQGFVQGVEELSSSSSSSTVRSAGITTAAVRTAAVIHEVDEDESGGSLAWSADQKRQQRQTEMKRGTSWFWTADRCQRPVRTHGALTLA